MNESNHQTDALIGQLRQLQPARPVLDVRETFYQVGYEACRLQMRSKQSHRLAVAVAAALIAMIVMVPTSYLAGKTAASGSVTQDLVQADLTGPQSGQSDRYPHDHLPTAPTPASTLPPPVRQIPEGVELAASDRNTRPLASWMNPLRSIARSTKLDRQAESMQTTSHASLFVLESSIRNLSELPFAVTPTSQDSTIVGDDSTEAETNDWRRTLVVGDLNALAIGLEAAQ